MNILEDLVEYFFIAYKVNLTLNIYTCFDKMWFNKTFQNSRQNLSENELRKLFVAEEREAFSYPANITKFVWVMQNFLVILHYFKKFTQKLKIMLLGFRIFKNVPSVSK